MAIAKNLRELLFIRNHNQDYINSITGNLGSALGLKNGDGDPCIIIFIPRKIKKKWLPGSKLIKDKLEAPGGIYCPLDVVEGSKYDSYLDVNLLDVTLIMSPYRIANTVSSKELLGPTPLSSPGRVSLLEQLKGWTDVITPGSQLYHGDGWYGTLGCFAKDRSGQTGIITNKHVAGNAGDILYFPEQRGETSRKSYKYN